MQRKNVKMVLVLSLVLTLVFGMATAFASPGNFLIDDPYQLESVMLEGNRVRTNYDFLLQAGMPQEEIATLDSITKEFIVNNLREAGVTPFELEYIDLEVVPTIVQRVNQLLTGVTYTVFAFRSGNTVFIYPTYEFTTARRPRGQDSFAVSLGDALQPFNYGGQLWARDPLISPVWDPQWSLHANTQSFSGAAFSGSQLGTPSWPVQFRGNTFIHANIGSGSDRRIIMTYMYNPNRNNFSISFSAFGLGVSFNSSGNIWTSASTQVLNF